jgi:hypothetical protein
VSRSSGWRQCSCIDLDQGNDGINDRVKGVRENGKGGETVKQDAGIVCKGFPRVSMLRAIPWKLQSLLIGCLS